MLTPIPEPTTVYPIGTTYTARGPHKRLCRVVDVLRTYNSKGELVRIRYVSEHISALHSTVTDYDVVATTIARGIQQ